MPFIKTDFPGLLIFEPVVFEDSRGYFFESYNQKTCLDAGVDIKFVQDNQAKSSYGVIRGLHYQLNPHAQIKFIRVLAGKILDVVVDIRTGSPVFGKAYSIELSAENHRQLFVPPGFAHGYAVLSETAEVLYKCDTFYHKGSEAGIAYNDANLGIDWQIPAGKQVISEKDTHQPSLKDCKNNFVFNS
ncbi:MAG: dTDP-4-dehydrorhamnose 3,5-epimerase [Ferruginibacter sp.]